MSDEVRGVALVGWQVRSGGSGCGREVGEVRFQWVTSGRVTFLGT